MNTSDLQSRRGVFESKTEVVWICTEERWWVYWDKVPDDGTAMKEETRKVETEVCGCGDS